MNIKRFNINGLWEVFSVTSSIQPILDKKDELHTFIQNNYDGVEYVALMSKTNVLFDEILEALSKRKSNELLFTDYSNFIVFDAEKDAVDIFVIADESGEKGMWVNGSIVGIVDEKHIRVKDEETDEEVYYEVPFDMVELIHDGLADI